MPFTFIYIDILGIRCNTRYRLGVNTIVCICVESFIRFLRVYDSGKVCLCIIGVKLLKGTV